MKRILFMALALLALCLCLTSCAANMSTPGYHGRNDDHMTDIITDDIMGGSNEDGRGQNGFGGYDGSFGAGAGDYRADSNGRVRSYNSDNDIGF